jgi:FtsH-binding integral membrane protein
MSQTVQKKRYVLFSLAIVLFALAAIAFLVGPSYSSVRPFGGIACIAAVYLVRMSNVHRSQSLPNVPVAGVGFTEERRFRRRLWVMSIALVPLLGVALILMYVDAANGGKESWPAYVFAGVGLICAAVWGGLIANISNSK